ncbi:MAG: 1,4-dihydroxy-2-naphthoate octaprenyltransferase [Pseudomonadota bacterium]
MSLGSSVKAWIQASRTPFFVATLIPLGLGGVVSYSMGEWRFERWLLVLLASFLVHLATNLANDYFDYFEGVDDGDSIGGSRVIQEGKISPRQIGMALILLYILAFCCGIWIVYLSRLWWLAFLMVFAFASSLFYTAPPIRYGYYGLGEIFVGINMGPVMVVGCNAALAGRFTLEAFWVSIPIAIMVAMILYYQSLSDIDEDRAVGKITLAVRFGKPGAIWGVRFFMAASVISIVSLVCFGILRPIGYVTLLTIIQAFSIDRMISQTDDWKELHDKGSEVRLFYLANGIIVIMGSF